MTVRLHARRFEFHAIAPRLALLSPYRCMSDLNDIDHTLADPISVAARPTFLVRHLVKTASLHSRRFAFHVIAPRHVLKSPYRCMSEQDITRSPIPSVSPPYLPGPSLGEDRSLARPSIRIPCYRFAVLVSLYERP